MYCEQAIIVDKYAVRPHVCVDKKSGFQLTNLSKAQVHEEALSSKTKTYVEKNFVDPFKHNIDRKNTKLTVADLALPGVQRCNFTIYLGNVRGFTLPKWNL